MGSGDSMAGTLADTWVEWIRRVSGRTFLNILKAKTPRIPSDEISRDVGSERPQIMKHTSKQTTSGIKKKQDQIYKKHTLRLMGK